MRILDLFCGGGGAGMGYHRAGFEVVGVDIKPQPRYPFAFVQMDAIATIETLLAGNFITDNHGGAWYLCSFDAIHASPPCQKYTLAGQQWRKSGVIYSDLVEKTRQALVKSGKPYIIENVPGAPLINPVVLNGMMFGMNLRRTRLFETSFDIPFFLLPKEGPSRFRMGRSPQKDDPVVPVGHFSGVDKARRVMEIDWMTQKELTQAIPPAYTKYLSHWLLLHIERARVGGAS